MLVYYKYLKLNNYNKIAMRMLKNKFCIIILVKIIAKIIRKKKSIEK